MKTQRNKVSSAARTSKAAKPRPVRVNRPGLVLVPKRPTRKARRWSPAAMVLFAILVGGAAIVIAMLYAAAPLHADTPPAGGDPMAMVRGVMDQTISVFKDKGISAVDRRLKLRAIAEAHFDFEGMARSAVGYHWRTFSDDQRKEFTPLFTSFIEDVALSQIEKYSVEKVQQDIQSSVIVFTREQIEGDRAEVFSTVTLQKTRWSQLSHVQRQRRVEDLRYQRGCDQRDCQLSQSVQSGAQRARLRQADRVAAPEDRTAWNRAGQLAPLR